jgi:hypothetical protein
MMRTELIIIENEQDLAEAHAMIAALGTTEDPAEGARLKQIRRMHEVYGIPADLFIREPERAVA